MALGTETPSYVVISRPLSGKEADPRRWLGRLVRTLNRPTDEYVPEYEHNLLPIIGRYLRDELDDADANTFVRGVQDEGLRTRLINMFGSEKTSDTEGTVHIATPRIATLTLQQHQRVFNVLMEDETSRKQVKDMLSSLGTLFMIVGVKVVYDATVNPTTGPNQGQRPDSTASVTDIAATSPMPITPSRSPEIGQSREQVRSPGASCGFTGGRIFAFQYRKVTLTRTLTRTMNLSRPKYPGLFPDLQPSIISAVPRGVALTVMACEQVPEAGLPSMVAVRENYEEYFPLIADDDENDMPELGIDPLQITGLRKGSFSGSGLVKNLCLNSDSDDEGISGITGLPRPPPPQGVLPGPNESVVSGVCGAPTDNGNRLVSWAPGGGIFRSGAIRRRPARGTRMRTHQRERQDSDGVRLISLQEDFESSTEDSESSADDSESATEDFEFNPQDELFESLQGPVEPPDLSVKLEALGVFDLFNCHNEFCEELGVFLYDGMDAERDVGEDDQPRDPLSQSPAPAQTPTPTPTPPPERIKLRKFLKNMKSKATNKGRGFGVPF